MEPVTGIVGKEAAGGLLGIAKKWLTPNIELKRELELAKAQIANLEAQLDAKREFERRKAELECLSDDDCLYRRRDGTGPYYCPLCLDADQRFVPVTHGTNEGGYFCSLHRHGFATRELRERRRNTSHTTYRDRRRLLSRMR
jgi:hypothetical protein